MSASQVNRLPPAKRRTPVAENYWFTTINTVKRIYNWTISDFRINHEENDKPIRSTTFAQEIDTEILWQLHAYPNKDFFSIFLTLFRANKQEAYAKFRFSLLNANGKMVNIWESKSVKRFTLDEGYGFNDFIRTDALLDEANSLLPNGRLTIVCEVNLVGDYIHSSSQSNPVQINYPERRQIEDFGDLFESSKFSDVTIAAGGTEIRAHKAILASRSSVIAGMLDVESHRLNISDVNEEVLQEFIRFLYTGKAPKLESMADKLFVAADRYRVMALKYMCEEVLQRTLSVENAANTLILADLHSSMELKEAAINYIVCHATDVSVTDGWKVLTMSHPQLLLEAYKKLLTERISPFG